MRRGDVFLVDLDPSLGAETTKTRPAILVSNDAANTTANRNGRGIVTVVPITSNTSRVYPFQVLLAAERCGLPHESKAQAEQIRSVSVERIGEVIGRLPPDLIEKVDEAIRLHLAL